MLQNFPSNLVLLKSEERRINEEILKLIQIASIHQPTAYFLWLQNDFYFLSFFESAERLSEFVSPNFPSHSTRGEKSDINV